jgi:hypothetical protein
MIAILVPKGIPWKSRPYEFRVKSSIRDVLGTQEWSSRLAFKLQGCGICKVLLQMLENCNCATIKNTTWGCW